MAFWFGFCWVKRHPFFNTWKIQVYHEDFVHAAIYGNFQKVCPQRIAALFGLPSKKIEVHVLDFRLCKKTTAGFLFNATRRGPVTSSKRGYNPYKWPYTWVYLGLFQPYKWSYSSAYNWFLGAHLVRDSPQIPQDTWDGSGRFAAAATAGPAVTASPLTVSADEESWGESSSGCWAYGDLDVDVSKNRGTPKCMVYNGKPY